MSIGQKKQTAGAEDAAAYECPAEGLLKLLSGKWKAQIFRLALQQPLRFNHLLRQIPGANKQSLAVALRELEAQQVLHRTVVCQKPLHVEYHLSEKGRGLVGVFKQLEGWA